MSPLSSTTAQPEAIQMSANKPADGSVSKQIDPATGEPASGEKHSHNPLKAWRLRGGGAGKDCFLGLLGCFLCFECCEGCCDCVADIICCPCEMCC
ncbi:hypothetical protein DFP72DRAFT_1174690 [Ephemerocybe angulata]|uniref:Uncharacterized protein n=1 Tax=Ephemerocybe angulata TaxID=980116 RepID=A0A8H6HKH3_9AGAR|nr:hypothetical protein DFP72DRAFT_1174690 [Tulosesus angulatus]